MQTLGLQKGGVFGQAMKEVKDLATLLSLFHCSLFLIPAPPFLFLHQKPPIRQWWQQKQEEVELQPEEEWEEDEGEEEEGVGDGAAAPSVFRR